MRRSLRIFPLSMGGLRLTSAVRSRVAAPWSSWADCTKMVRDRHSIVAEVSMRGIDHDPVPVFPRCKDLRACFGGPLLEIHLGERCPSLCQFVRHSQNRVARRLVGSFWEEQHFASHWLQLSEPDRSQSGPLSLAALTALATSRATRIAAQPIRLAIRGAIRVLDR